MAGEPSDRWEHGDAYERYVGRWSRRVAPAFLAWLGLPPGPRWLDVGCGTGALCAAILDGCAPSSLVGVDPSAGFLAAARARLPGVDLRQGDAGRIPLDDASVDAVVSGLVLNFVPDPRGALAEMARVSAPGGTVAAYVWDYAGGMQLIRHFWDAAVELDPRAARLDEAVRFPTCRPDALVALLADAGFAAVDVTAIEVPTPIRDFDEYWSAFLGGQGPAPSYLLALEAPARERLRARLRERMPGAVDGSLPLTARAWAVRGTAAG